MTAIQLNLKATRLWKADPLDPAARSVSIRPGTRTRPAGCLPGRGLRRQRNPAPGSRIASGFSQSGRKFSRGASVVSCGGYVRASRRATCRFFNRAADRTFPDRLACGQRGNGRGLSRHGHTPGPHGSDQDAARRLFDESGVASPLRTGSPRRGTAEPSQRPDRLRRRHSRRARPTSLPNCSTGEELRALVETRSRCHNGAPWTSRARLPAAWLQHTPKVLFTATSSLKTSSSHPMAA